jgi:hypothetical protein
MTPTAGARPGSARGWSVLLALLLATQGAGTARAERIAIESYVGKRPADADRVVRRIRTVFARHGFTVQPAALARLFRAHAFQPGVVSPSFAKRLQSNTEEGENAFMNEDFNGAAKILGALIEEMRRNPLVVARDPESRALAFRSLLSYALASGRQAVAALASGDADRLDVARDAVRRRDAAMAELIRSFPARVLTTKEHGHEAELLYKRCLDELDSAGRGRLTVTVSDRNAVIYVNELAQGPARVALGGLPPGVYRVLVQLPTEEAREYDVEVTANQEARLDIDWDLDSMLVVNAAWVGFSYPTEQEHAFEARFVRDIVYQHTNATLAATVTVARSHGHPAIVGTIYAVKSGRLVRSSMAELTGKHDEEAIEHLVGCLLAEQTSGCLVVDHPEYTPPPAASHDDRLRSPQPSEPRAHVTPASPGEPDSAYLWPGIAIGAGIASAAIGGFLQATTPDVEGTQPRHIYGNAGISLLVGGGLATLGGLYWLYHEGTTRRDASAAPIVAITPSTALVGWRAVF